MQAHSTMTSANSREIATLVPMARLLESLGFVVNKRTRRAPCLLHSGSNPTAFSWTEAGLWHCHSCGRGGDRITLVRETRKCSFREAVEFLASLAGVNHRTRRVSGHVIAQRQYQRARAERAAWQVSDEIARLRRYFTDGLHRSEKLQAHLGNQLLLATTEVERNASWERLAQLAQACSYF